MSENKTTESPATGSVPPADPSPPAPQSSHATPEAGVPAPPPPGQPVAPFPGYVPPPNPYGNPYANTYAQNYGPAVPPRGMSITSMVLGIVSLIATLFALGWLTAIPGVVFGHIGLKREPAGRGMAIAGLIMNYAALAIGIIILVFIVLGFALFFFTLTSVSRL